MVVLNTISNIDAEDCVKDERRVINFRFAKYLTPLRSGLSLPHLGQTFDISYS